jgi:ribosomal protein S12 methylthiotransferase accessory factor
MGSQIEVSHRGRIVDIERIATRPGSPVGPDHRMLWAQGVELIANEPILLPYGLIHVNSVPPFPPGDECFFVTSNGLASGSVMPEAVVHALCEVVERDAVSRWRSTSTEVRAARWIDLETADEPIVVHLLERCESMGFDVLACDADSPAGLPVIVCILLDRRESARTLRGAAMGFGCHLRRDVAFVRALTEAAQSRLTLIAGSRDDLDRSDYESRRRHWDGIHAYRRLVGDPHTLDFRSLPDHRGVQLQDQVTVLVERLSVAGVNEIALVDLTTSPHGPAVVRTVVPGMLGPDYVH